MLRFAPIALVLALTAPAAADPSVTVTSAALPSPSMRVELGLFSPVGALGVVYSRPVHRLAAVEIGAGIGFSGLQLSAMAKLRRGEGRTKFTPGIGVSVGLPVLGTSIHEGHPTGDDEMRGADVTSAWLDVDVLGVEHRTTSGFVFSASGGVTVALTKGHWDAADLGDDIEPFNVLPQFRLGVGKAF